MFLSNDARRWVRVPLIGMTFMPSDLAKLSLITNLAGMLAKRQHVEYTFVELVPMILKNTHRLYLYCTDPMYLLLHCYFSTCFFINVFWKSTFSIFNVHYHGTFYDGKLFW